MKDPVTDLADRLALLRVRYEVAFHSPFGAPGPVHALAVALSLNLRHGMDDAVRMTRAVVDPGDLDRPEFWGTPLGRLLFEAGGHVGETMTQTAAAAVLGCSRQWVNAMVAEDKLTSAAERGVYVEQVRAVLKHRADRLLVKDVK